MVRQFVLSSDFKVKGDDNWESAIPLFEKLAL